MEKLFNNLIKWSIYLLVFLLPLFFLPFSYEAFEYNKQYLMFFLVFLGIFSWIAKMILVDKEIKIKKNFLNVFILGFVLLAAIGTIFSVDASSSFFGFYGRFNNGLISLVVLALMYFLITNNVSLGEGKKDSKEIVKSSSLLRLFSISVFLIVVIAFLSIFGVWSKLSSILPSGSIPSVMLQNTFNTAARSMEALSVFFAVYLIYLMGKVINSLAKKFDYILIGLITVFLILIDFMTAWLIITFSLLVFLIIVLRKRTFKEDTNKLLLPIIFLIISIFFCFVSTAGLQSKILGTQLVREAVLDQGQSWATGLGGATENIKSVFFGSGIGTYHYDFSKFKTGSFNETAFWQLRFDRAGSHIAEILGTMGFLGLIIYLALIGFFLMISYLRFVQLQKVTPLLLMFLGLLIAQFFFYQNTILAFAFWLALSLSVVGWEKQVKEKKISFKEFPELSLVVSVVSMIMGILLLIVFFFAGKFYLADVDYRNAVGEERTANLEKAVELNPYQVQYKIILARDYLNKVITEGEKPQDQQNQALLSEYTQKAIAYSKGGQLNGSIIKGTVEVAPNRVAAWETLGMIYRDIRGLAQGALDWGVKSFQEAINLEPTNPIIRTELAKLYLDQGEKDKAIEEFNKASELKPSYIDPVIQIALLYEADNKLPEAIALLEELESQFPYNIDLLFQLGRLYFNNNEIDESIQKLQMVVVLMPDYSNAHYSLGLAYQKKGKTQDAISEFEKVLELNPDNTDVKSKLNSLKESSQ